MNRSKKSSGQHQAFDRITVEKNAFTPTLSPPNANQLLHQDASKNETTGPVKSPTGQQMEPTPTYKPNKSDNKALCSLVFTFVS